MRFALLVVACIAMLFAAHTALMADGLFSVWPDSADAVAVQPSWFGSSGLIYVPSALTLPMGRANVSYHRVQNDIEDMDLANINVGLPLGIEVGGARIKGADSASNEIINVKWQVPASAWLKAIQLPEVAVGGWDLGNQLNRTVYVVMSKALPLGLSSIGGVAVHAGYAAAETNGGSMDGLFAGAEFSAFKHTTVQAEFDGDAFNADLRWNLSPRLTVDVGTLDGDFGFGASYTGGF